MKHPEGASAIDVRVAADHGHGHDHGHDHEHHQADHEHGHADHEHHQDREHGHADDHGHATGTPHVHVGDAPRRMTQLRAAGLRATPARVQVLVALDAAHHATVEDIYARIAPVTSGVSVSTIYRTVETLEEVGLVSHTHIADGMTTYQLAEAATHAHLVCRTCHGVTELSHEVTDRLVADTYAETGFRADAGHLSVFGQCRDCASADWTGSESGV